MRCLAGFLRRQRSTNMISKKSLSTTLLTILLRLSQHNAASQAQRQLRQSLRGGGRRSQPLHSPGSNSTAATALSAYPSRHLLSPDDIDSCNRNGQELFQLDIQIDDNPCETSWLLEHIPKEGKTINIDGHGHDHENEYHIILDNYFGTSHHADDATLCLDPGHYRFTIYDAYGDGIQTPGYYMIALDGMILAGSSNFGYEESTSFTVVGSPSLMAETSQHLAQDTDMDEKKVIDNNTTIPIPERLTGIIVPTTALPSMSPTAAPSTMPPTAVPSTSQPTESFTHSRNQWVEIWNEDFEHDLGIFHAESDEYITYYPFVKERRGVVRLQDEPINHNGMSSSIYSDSITIVPSSFAEIRLIFTFYANSMEQLHNDGFCVDYSIDDGKSWHSKQCWHAAQDFDNGRWYDDTVVSFNLLNDIHGHGHGYGKDASSVVDAFRIRLRCKTDSLYDDVLIDRVQLLGLVGDNPHWRDSG